MEVITGAARSGKSPKDDQVCLKSFQSVSNFVSNFSAYKVYRVVDKNAANTLASVMITACNNNNILYSQGSRHQIFENGANATVTTYCDCSSLVSYCATMALGVKINGTSTTIGGQLSGTGQFMSPVSVTTLSETNPPMAGDILQKSGHVEMVVSAGERIGSTDELLGTTFAGNATAITSYMNMNSEHVDFTPRTTEPVPSEHGEKPEEDPYRFYQQSYGISKNASYAWGRFSEIMNSMCNLSRGDARRWYLYQEDGYSRGTAPSLGAVMCFANIDDPNHGGIVCIVEKIEPDGRIYVSQRDISTGAFQYIQKVRQNGSWDMDMNGDGRKEMQFQGFIYNPGVLLGVSTQSAMDTFIKVAEEQVGDKGQFTEQYTGIVTSSSPWSAAFIVAVAQRAGSLINVVIPNTFSCSEIGRIGITRSMGTWLNGPAQGGKVIPQPGDIALFRYNSKGNEGGQYGAEKAGIVVLVNGNENANVDATNESTAKYSFNVVIGDCEGGGVKKKTYTSDSQCLSGIFRPNWMQVDGTSQSIQQYYTFEGLYTEGTSRDDAAIRDLKYINVTDNGFEPSINKTKLMLCAINYTGMLANMYSSLAEVGSSTATDANLVVDLWNNSVQSSFQTGQDDFVSIISGAAGEEVDSSVLDVDMSKINSNGSMTVTIPTRDARMGKNNNTTTATITITPTVQEIFKLLCAGLNGNAAAAIGVMGNIFQESKFDPTIYGANDTSVSYVAPYGGLLCWTNTYSKKYGWYKMFDNMKNFCKNYGSRVDYKNNLPGQIAFIFSLVNENSQYATGINKLKKVPNSQQGAIQAAKIFLDYYQIGAGNIGTTREIAEAGLRGDWAKYIWILLMGGKK